ncbi:MAG: hypothetical protein L3J69_06630 [Desulfobacula sp.]|nr:hypothetical protein [Desulfobacula sp.]
MLKKKFGITLIIISTLVYGSIFFLSMHHETSFFDEILIQLNRAAGNLNKKDEIQQSKFILKTIIENDHPPQIWKNLIAHNPQNDNEELFYYYKIWTIRTKLSMDDIAGSYPIFEKTKNGITHINMRYGKDKPVLQFPFFRNNAGNLVTGLFFPINERSMSADYNKDNKVNYKDVILARKRE